MKLTLTGEMHEARDIKQMGNSRAQLSITTHNTGTTLRCLQATATEGAQNLHSAHLVKNTEQATVYQSQWWSLPVHEEDVKAAWIWLSV